MPAPAIRGPDAAGHETAVTIAVIAGITPVRIAGGREAKSYGRAHERESAAEPVMVESAVTETATREATAETAAVETTTVEAAAMEAAHAGGC